MNNERGPPARRTPDRRPSHRRKTSWEHIGSSGLLGTVVVLMALEDYMPTGTHVRTAGLRLNGDVLRLAMAHRGLTVTELAEIAKVSPSTISAATRGRPIAPGTLRAIARALESLPVVVGADVLLAG